jgi:hypothetical protein
MEHLKEREWTREELKEIAKYQKYIIYLVPFSLGIMLPFILPVLIVVQCYNIYKLAVAIRSRFVWFYVVSAFIPLISLLSLLRLNSRATEILKRNGINVGFMGVKMEDFDKLQDLDKPQEFAKPQDFNKPREFDKDEEIFKLEDDDFH